MRRSGLTDEEKATIWRMARMGSNWVQISRHLDRHVSSVHNYARWHGGVPPRRRRRCEKQLSLAEREEVSRGLAAGWSLRQIAAELDRSPSTVSREVGRNGGRDGYRATVADRAATERACRPKVCKLAATPRLRAIVEDKLRDDWSPEQISRWLRRAFPDDPELQVSHETIYLSLFVQARGLLRKELTAHLRTKRMVRRGKTITDRRHGKGQIVGAVHISERPAEAEDRAVPGHWEGDMLIGSRFTQITTLVERHSRFVMLIALPSRSTDDVVPAVAAHIQTLPEQLRKSLTWDRGTEMAKHAQFTIDTGVQVYFCDPRSPWQRGTNENTNGLLRQYFPKRTSLAGISQADLDLIAAKLNRRPRKTLDWPPQPRRSQRRCTDRLNPTALCDGREGTLQGVVGHGVFAVSEVPSPRWNLALELLEDGRGFVLLEDEVTIALRRSVAGPAPDTRLHVSIYARNEPGRISSPMAAADVRAGLASFAKAAAVDPRLSELGERHGKVIEYLYDYGMGAVLVGTVTESGDLNWSHPFAPTDEAT